ncbi:S-layer homology domain-containing protein [Paenibacillus sp. BGI2013]|uniref:S-layer homology domain-containing protein n=1 Tax=Paenibacillus sp. BGI2013 TaxID=2058902 RepID=UPI000C6E0996|nr:S-layer homology domain-containing protein [Paenibacillus sp. BGI2013]PKQ89336.1 S-layer homology domain-containing protein [Paenibacillus sp. BGI2013]
MKKIIITGVTALALLTGGAVSVGGIGNPVQASQATLKFKDVPSTHWAAAAINSAVELGYFKGYTDGTFKPSSPVTKAEMASILGRLDQPNSSSPGSNNFTDIPEWAQSGVTSAIQKGFINPTNYKGKLDAKTSLKRGEMAVWLTQGLATVDSDYKKALTDVKNTVVPAKEYFSGDLAASEKNAVAVAMGTGLMSVYNDKMFGSDRTTTRAEVAVLIARYASVAKTKASDYKALNELRQVGLTGTNLSLITDYFKKTPENQVHLTGNRKYDNVTDDFSKVRNKEIVTDTNYADLKVSNWIIVDTSVADKDRSIYYPVFVDEGVKLQSGKYFSFVEFDLKIKSASMNQLQAGSLLNSATFNPLRSPNSNAFLSYGAPKAGDYTKNRGVFTVNNPVYWAQGLLHFYSSAATAVTLESKDGSVFSVIDTK